MSETERARPRVLLVDDEEGVRMSLRALLEGEYRIESVPSGGGAGAAALPSRRRAARRTSAAEHERARCARAYQGVRRAHRGRDDHRLRLARHPQRGAAPRCLWLSHQAVPAPGPGTDGPRRDGASRPAAQLTDPIAPLTGLVLPVRICSHTPSQATRGYRP